MRFFLIDRICELEDGTRARGIKNVCWDDPFLREPFPGLPGFSPVIACESVAQLVSWVIVAARDFTVKPVITAVDSYRCCGHVSPGDQLEVSGEIESFSPESALAHGRIVCCGRTVIEIEHAVCYLYPLSELDPPEDARRQFGTLYTPGYPVPGTDSGALLQREHIPLPAIALVDRVFRSEDPNRLSGIKNITATEEYFRDHFPRKPIVPGVVIMESMIDLGAQLITGRLPAGVRPILQGCRKIKFRSFVQPGDQLLIEAAVVSCDAAGSTVKITARLNGKTAAMLQTTFRHCDPETYQRDYCS